MVSKAARATAVPIQQKARLIYRECQITFAFPLVLASSAVVFPIQKFDLYSPTRGRRCPPANLDFGMHDLRARRTLRIVLGNCVGVFAESGRRFEFLETLMALNDHQEIDRLSCRSA
jgi:hypothetical protein